MIFDKVNESSETMKVYLTGVILIFMMVVFAFIFSLHTLSGKNIRQLERTNNILLLCEQAIIENIEVNKTKNK